MTTRRLPLLLLGANLWALLVGVPLLHAGGAPTVALAAALAPVALLALACALPVAPLAYFAFPTSLLLPLLLHPPLRVEAALSPAAAAVVALALVSFFASAGPQRGPDRPWLTVALLGAALAGLLHLVHFSEPVASWLARTLPGRVAEARTAAAMLAFLGWLVAAWAALGVVSLRARRRAS